MLSKKSVIKIAIISIVFTLLWFASNFYFLYLDNPKITQYIKIHLMIITFITNLLTYFIILYLVVLKYKKHFGKIKSRVGKAFLGAAISAGTVFIIVLLRYIFMFAKSKGIGYFLSYTGLEAFVLFPLQIILIIPTMIYGKSLTSSIAPFLGYIGILTIPLIWGIISFIIVWVHESGKSKVEN